MCCAIHWIKIYPVHSNTQPSNNWGQKVNSSCFYKLMRYNFQGKDISPKLLVLLCNVMKYWIYKPCANNCFKDRFKCQRENQKQKKKNLEGILHLECTQAEVSN